MEEETKKLILFGLEVNGEIIKWFCSTQTLKYYAKQIGLTEKDYTIREEVVKDNDK